MFEAESRRRAKEEHIHYVERVIKMLGTQYDITDDILAYVRKITSFFSDKVRPAILRTQRQPPKHGLQENLSTICCVGDWVTIWCEKFLADPHTYLRLSKLLDWTLSHGHFPEENEIYSLYVLLGIDPQLCVSDSSFEVWSKMTFTFKKHLPW